MLSHNYLEAAMSVQIMVLNDGETYTDVKGCMIVTIADDIAESLAAGQITVPMIVDDHRLVINNVITFE